MKQQGENILRHPMVIFGISVGEEIVTDPDLLLCLQEALMIMLEDVFWRDATPVSFDRDGGAVTIGAADHQHMIATQTVIARENIGGQVGTGEVADMQVAIGVGPGYRYVDILC